MKHRGIKTILILLSLLSLSGCAVRREADGISLSEDASMEELTGKVYRVKNEAVKVEDVLQVVFGMSEEEARENILYEEGMTYETDGKSLNVAFEGYIFAPSSGDELIDFMAYTDNKEDAVSCYDNVIQSDIMGWLSENVLRQNLPLESISSCTKEEAIEACRPYAEVMGYEDAEVSVYAVTLDMLEKRALKAYGTFNEAEYRYSGAPDPEFEPVSRQQIKELQNEGKTEEAEQLLLYANRGASEKGIPWEEKHEALFLTYQPYIDGIVMKESYDLMYMLYVPLYGRPISIYAPTSYEVEELLEEGPLISKDKAASRAMQVNGHTSVEEMEVKQISLVYGLQRVAEGETSWSKAIPCWNVEYLYKGKEYRVWIDAIYGDEYTQFPEC